MRLYILAIGGTGSRVLKSLIMQFAAGILPRDPDTHEEMTDVSVVPIIVDPHKSNQALQSVNDLMKKYRDIRTKLYGDKPTLKGFYGIKIESLKDVATDNKNNSTAKIPDSFFFDMPESVSQNHFMEFIGMDDPIFLNQDSQGPKILSKILFSNDELTTKMSEGFYGSPNIGTIALNVFQESDSYKGLGQNFRSGDRLFFIGSIFGGTGAAGLPMFVSSIRQDKEYTALSSAYMGALIVMPYFTIESKKDSEIKGEDFVIKTKTALKYYVDNLNPYLNCVYYVADELGTKPFENDPGKGDQKTNKAHFVEFIGGLSVMDFINQRSKGDGENTRMDGNRKIAAEDPKFREFELKEDTYRINFSHLGKTVNRQIFYPMTSFHILQRFVMDGFFKNSLSQTFARGRGIDGSAITDDMERFFSEYRIWMDEIGGYGDGVHNFVPFVNDTVSKNFSSDIEGVKVKRGAFKKNFEVSHLINGMNKSTVHEESQLMAGKLFMMIHEALNGKENKEGLISEYYELKDIL